MLADPFDHGSHHATRQVRRNFLSLALLHDEVGRIEQDLDHLSHLFNEYILSLRQLSTNLAHLREVGRRQLRNLVGTEASGDVPQTLVEETIHEHSPRQEGRKVVAEILYFSSDVQTLAG